jgi:NAD-dependent deacetylase
MYKRRFEERKFMDEIERFRALLANCERAVVFTGAGISTESGIPDFRGPGGLWTKMKPIQFQDFVASDTVRQQSWQQRFEHGRNLFDVEPNSGHLAVAALIERGVASAVITQNIDNLHQNSGIPAEKVIELHGNGTYAKCLGCGQIYTMDAIEREFSETGRVEACQECGGIVKSATISFGQAMPEEPMQRAETETLACDLFIVLGSSLTVYPAAGFPALARNNGAELVIVNEQATDMDSTASLVIRAGIGATMTTAVAITPEK